MMEAVQIHLALNHFAIVTALLGTFVLIFGLAKNHATTVAAACWLFLIGAAAGVVTYLSGEGAEDFAHEQLNIPEEFIHQHEEIALFTLISYAVLAVLALITLLKNKGWDRIRKPLVFITLVAALATSALGLYTGHLGGQIRHTELRNPGTTVEPHQDKDS